MCGLGEVFLRVEEAGEEGDEDGGEEGMQGVQQGDQQLSDREQQYDQPQYLQSLLHHLQLLEYYHRLLFIQQVEWYTSFYYLPPPVLLYLYIRHLLLLFISQNMEICVFSAFQYSIIIVNCRMKRPRPSTPQKKKQERKPSPLTKPLQTVLSRQDDSEPLVTHIPMHFKSEAHMNLLLRYLGVLRRQLPNMPLPHLISLLFSTHHESLVLTQAGTLCGGLTFRQPYKKDILELELLASSESGKGYGSHLVNHLKQLAQMRNIRIIFTHADNTAISFYEKLGFSTREHVRKMELGREVFTDSTVMQSVVDNTIDYFSLKDFHRKQRQIVTQEYKKTAFEVFKIATLREPFQMGSDYFRMDPLRIQDLDFDKEYKRLIATKEQQVYRKYVVHIDRLIAMAHPELVKMREELLQLPFLEYSQPMELQMLRENALAGEYEMKEEMMHDLQEFQRNCRTFYASHPAVITSLDAIKQELELIRQEL